MYFTTITFDEFAGLFVPAPLTFLESVFSVAIRTVFLGIVGLGAERSMPDLCFDTIFGVTFGCHAGGIDPGLGKHGLRWRKMLLVISVIETLAMTLIAADTRRPMNASEFFRLKIQVTHCAV